MASIEVGHLALSRGGKPVRWNLGEVPGVRAVVQSLGTWLGVQGLGTWLGVRAQGPPQSGQLPLVERVLGMAGVVRPIGPLIIHLQEAGPSLPLGSFCFSLQAAKAWCEPGKEKIEYVV